MIRRTEDGISWYEDEFPPKRSMMEENCGYDSWNERMLFYEFAVNMYDMVINHKGEKYIIEVEPNEVRWINPDSLIVRKEWDFPIKFIKDFEIEGRKLYEIVNELEDLGWM